MKDLNIIIYSPSGCIFNFCVRVVDNKIKISLYSNKLISIDSARSRTSFAKSLRITNLTMLHLFPANLQGLKNDGNAGMYTS